MPVRRNLDPVWVQHIWNAIRSAMQQKQMADMGKILKYLQRVDKISLEKAELCVKQCLQDGLIAIHPRAAHAKSTNGGPPIECYRIPMNETTELPVDDGKDWYCFECHLAGDVNVCKNCHRVFHHECGVKARQRHLATTTTTTKGGKAVSETSSNSSGSRTNSAQSEAKADMNRSSAASDEVQPNANDEVINLDCTAPPMERSEGEGGKVTPTEEKQKEEVEPKNNVIGYDEELCIICNSMRLDPDLGLEQEELNHLLAFVYNRIKSWIPSALSDKMAPDEKLEPHMESEIRWRCQQLFYQPMDMAVIDLKLRTQEYKHMAEFKADVLTVQHNIAIYHGIDSQEYGASEYMLQDCEHDLSELINCVDCYKHSNEKINSKWFCLPCRKPHKLVWAKQKGYPYWPAKILKETGTTCDVRFFGAKYERSVLAKNQVKHINTSLSSLHVKRSAAFNKAAQELALHQRLLTDPEELQRVLSIKSKPKSASLSERGSSSPASVTKRKANPIDVYDLDESLSDTDSSVRDKYVSRKRKNVSAHAPPKSPARRKSSTEQKKMDSSLEIVSDSDNDNFGMGRGSGINFNTSKAFDNRGEVSQAEVSSSTEHVTATVDHFPTATNDAMPQTDRQYSEAVEKTRRKMEQCRDKKQLIKVALECMQAEIDRINNDRDDYVKKLFEMHNQQISETKKKQWCYNCEQDAIYHCCWNTAYCSPTCQQQHWQAEHKKVCRRKR